MNRRALRRSALAVAAVGISLGLTAFAYRALNQTNVRFTFDDELWQLLDPRGLAVTALLPLIWLSALGSLSDLPLWQRLAGAATRSALLTCLGVALSKPVVEQRTTQVSTVFLVDVSDSIADEGLREAEQLVEQAYRARGDNDLKLVTFATSARRVALPEDPAAGITLARHGQDQRGSNPEAALRLALGLFPPGHLRRVVLVSDGLATEGQALAETSRMRDHDVRVFGAPLRSGPPPEQGVRELRLPDEIQVGGPFELQVELFATRKATVQLSLFQDARPNALDPSRTVSLERGSTTVTMRSVVHMAGPVTYRVELKSESEDSFEANNHFSRSVEVPGPPRILYVDSAPERADAFTRALEAGGFQVERRRPAGAPLSARELSGFDFFILSDVPSAALPHRTTKAIEAYVRAGGGFLMAGGEHSFGLGGYRGTRMEQLLPVYMDAQRRKDQPSLAMALVIDKSGSMDGRKIQLAKEAARATAELLGPEDYIGVIGFDARPQRIVRMQSAKNRLGVSRDIGRLSAGGGTAIFPALDAAYGELAATRARVKHVILLTDGQTQEAGIPLLVENMRADGITVSTIGLGDDVNRGLLSELGRSGGGRSYFTSEPHNIPRLFVKETHEIARSSAVEDYVRVVESGKAATLRGVHIEAAPMLRGYVATRGKPVPAQVLLASELGEPILARRRLGLGWSLAWTSDLKPRWATDWLRWSQFSQLWSQLLREHMRPRPERDLPLKASVEGDQVRVVVDAIDADDRFLNGLEGKLRVEGPLSAKSNQRELLQLPLPQTAPGRHELRLPLPGFGTFLLSAELSRDGQVVQRASGNLSLPFPKEYSRFEPDPGRLESWAQSGGGRLLIGAEDVPSVFEAQGEHTEALKPRWHRFVWLALLLFVLDLALRRVRWFERAGGAQISTTQPARF